MALGREPVERGVHRQRLVEAREPVVDAVRDVVHRNLAPRPAERVDRAVAGRLRDPRPQRVAVAEGVEPFEDAREHLLEDVLGVVRIEPVDARDDRVDVPPVAVDERLPRGLVARAAAADELGVRRGVHRGPA